MSHRNARLNGLRPEVMGRLQLGAHLNEVASYLTAARMENIALRELNAVLRQQLHELREAGSGLVAATDAVMAGQADEIARLRAELEARRASWWRRVWRWITRRG